MGLEHALGVREHQRRRGFLEMNIKQGPKIVKRPIAGKISVVQRKMHDHSAAHLFESHKGRCNTLNYAVPEGCDALFNLCCL
ncbi:hypothetical protein [Rhizobium leguminosarum]|uniref:hypothetical protein n=1 Tax=Rhizobium leguminosarum TaxID=384 RepID=UPI0013E91BCD|nr:hypothetical protein [Rhizobium leguminosarum]